MAEVSITAVCVLNNPAAFTDPIVLEVQYECLSSLQEDLEWRVTYVGSAESDAYDQVLDSALVGPIQPGAFKFRMEAPPPDPSKIPTTDLLGVTALLLTCSYRGKEFVRVGYYVNVEYTDPELLDPERPPPHPPLLHKLQRSIMAEHPRVTKFPHDFDNTPAALPAPGEGEPEPEDDLLPEEDGEEEEEEDDDDEEEEDEGEEGEEEPDSEYEADVFEEELGEEQQQQQQAQRELGDVQMGTPGGGVAAAGGRTLQRTLQPGGDGDMDLENVAPAGHPSAAVAHEGKLAVQTAPQQPLLSHTEDVDMDACS